MTAVAPLAVDLSDLDIERIGDFAARLTRSQALWVSGYFAGVARAGAPANNPAPAAEPETVTILYGSETGNAAALARQFAARAAALGMNTSVQDMASYKPQGLKQEKIVVVVTSTHGEGDPPEPARGFFEFLHGRKAPKLEGLRYAVLGLGDSTYAHFCQAARDLDRQFAALGAVRLYDRVECDVDYDESASTWQEAVLEKLGAEHEASHDGASRRDVAVAVPAKSSVVKCEPLHTRNSPFSAPVIEHLKITGRGSSKDIRHIELALDGSGLTYQPGDALGIVPSNEPALVQGILETLGLSGTEPVQVGGTPIRVDQALSGDFEITALTPRFLAAWRDVSGSAELGRILEQDDQDARMRFMKANHVIDIVKAYPVKGIEPAAFIAMLRKLQPRLYSIASSQAAVPDEVHVTVATVRYELQGSTRLGVASGWLAERVRPDDEVPVYIQSNDQFRLPRDSAAPLIMIGAGTGVAPYRAFMQERAERGLNGPAWLFFGERQFRTDFLYQTEWQAWLKGGILSRIDLAFSRDQAEKIYVQHRMAEQARELYAWLQDGAHLYVCGDATAMAPDVEAALTSIVKEQGACSAEQASEYIHSLHAAGRYHRDVY